MSEAEDKWPFTHNALRDAYQKELSTLTRWMVIDILMQLHKKHHGNWIANEVIQFWKERK